MYLWFWLCRSRKVILRRKVWVVFALCTCGFGYAEVEKSYFAERYGWFLLYVLVVLVMQK